MTAAPLPAHGRSASRLDAIDWLRGLDVLVIVQAQLCDSG